MLTANDERQFVLRDQMFLLLVEEEKLLCNQISPGQTPVRSAPCVLFVLNAGGPYKRRPSLGRF